jgi:DNA-binding CsgD family transcriptional regulator
MARSKRLTVREVREVFRLLGECRELGVDVSAWQRHLAAGLCRITGAQVGLVGEVEYSQRAYNHPRHVADVGWSCLADRRRVMDFFASELYGRDLSAERFFRIFPLQSRTVSRKQIIHNSEWVRSAMFNDFIRPAGLDLRILSKQGFGGGERSMNLVLYSPLGEAPPPERSRRLVHLAQQELGPLLGTTLATAEEPGWSSLPPRWRQTLDCLLNGDSEKQAASRLGISQQTAHQYVKCLYKHFGVSSRSELLAIFIRRYGPSRPWSRLAPAAKSSSCVLPPRIDTSLESLQ